MTRNRRRDILLWGLCFMLAYLYTYEILLVMSLKPTPTAYPEHLGEVRQIPAVLDWIASQLSRFLTFFSFPMYALAVRVFSEPYYSECVYIPFTCALQWFGWGCLFAGWRPATRLKDAIRRYRQATSANN
jgi:hypothetical protein